MSRSIPLLFLLTGCITGGNYPDQYAKALCETTYACLDNDDIEMVSGYDDMEECIFEVGVDVRATDTYAEYDAGARSFDQEAAQLCLNEITEVQEDADCDGSMNSLRFISDMLEIQSDACREIFPKVK